MLVDRYNRSITYLRISITEHCNLRCVYCTPQDSSNSKQTSNHLTPDEFVMVSSVLAKNGLKYIRLTGGEPLVHPNIIEIVEKLAALPNIEEVSLTTNAMLLEKLAEPLAKAGLKRVNISLDTLDAEKFKKITRGGLIEKVWKGIEAANKVGLSPIKINTVVVNGMNDSELQAIARLTIDWDIHVRFIELMPVGNAHSWGEGFPTGSSRYLSVQQMQKILKPLNMQPNVAPVGNGPSKTYKIPGANGTVGFISPVGQHFCEQCNRLRLTADGMLRPCLLMDEEHDVMKAIRQKEDLFPIIQKALAGKSKSHELELNNLPESRRMAQIGG